MKKNSIFLCLFYFFCNQVAFAQFPDSLVADRKQFKLFEVAVAPKNLPALNSHTQTYDWPQILQLGLGMFYSGTRSDYDGSLYFSEEKIIGGMLGIAYQGRPLRWEVGVTYPKPHANYDKFYSEAVAPILKNKLLRESIYAWAIPHYKKVYQGFDKQSQEVVKKTLQHIVKYCKTIDVAQETAYWQLCSKGESDNFKFFTPKNAEKKVFDEYRLVETFVFRRVSRGEMAPKEISQIARRLLKELK